MGKARFEFGFIYMKLSLNGFLALYTIRYKICLLNEFRYYKDNKQMCYLMLFNSLCFKISFFKH